MKIFKIRHFIIMSLLALNVSCEDDKKFSGSPVDNLQIITLQGSISTPALSALTEQEIDVTASLPSNKTFNDTVTVEVSSIAKSGGRTIKAIDILPGQSSGTGKIEAVGGSIFNTTFDLKLTAIKLKTSESGKHYLITSPTVTLRTGNPTAPAANPEALIVRFVWPFPALKKNLRLFVDKPAPFADVNVNTLNSYGKQHTINNEGTANDLNVSSANGEYIFRTAVVSPTSLEIQPVDVPYRMIVVFPNGDIKVFEGVYEGLTTTSPLRSILKVNKSTSVDGVVTYTATDQF
jgi:hypothetical protein